MHLVFVHGWAFEAPFWDALAVLLPEFSQQRLDLGFFGNPSMHMERPPEESVLIGHSMGFMYGLKQSSSWKAWVSINGFSHFLDKPDQRGCVSPSSLRDLRIRLKTDAPKALAGFYKMIGSSVNLKSVDEERLLWGLNVLRDDECDTDLTIKRQPGLILATRQDPLVPATMSEAMERYGELIWHESGSHVLPQSDPEFCAHHLAGFIKRQRFVE